MKLKLGLAVLIVFCLLSLRSNFARTWTDSSGTHEIEAELVKLDGEVVHLKKADGTIIKVPLNKLCLGDQRFLQQQMAAKPAAPKADSDNVVRKPDSDDGNVVVKPGSDSDSVVSKPDSEVGSATSPPASAQPTPSKATANPALEKQKQEQLLAAQRKKLQQLQDLLHQAKAMPVRDNSGGSSRTRSGRKTNHGSSPAPSYSSEQAKKQRLALLQSQIDQLQPQIESVEAKTTAADSASLSTDENDKTAVTFDSEEQDPAETEKSR